MNMKDYTQESRNHFNKQAAVYDRNRSFYYSGTAKESCRDAQQFLSPIPFHTLLDVGCGTGFLIDQLAKTKDAEYFGLDISENMLNVAKAKNIPNALFTQSSADRLPYKDNFFDVVTCIQSFHHYQNPDKAMQEVFRVLRPGGLYLLSDTGVGGLGAWIDNHILFKLLKSGDCHTENKKAIEKRMAQNGFTRIESRQLKWFIYTVIGHAEKEN